LSNLENVSCKLSGLGMFEHNWTETSVKPIAKTVINQFGPKRVMFGSNFPVDSLSSSFDDLYKRLSNIIGTKNSEDIFFQTAKRIYFSKLSIS
jgi:predicted TIM-barrel fold metal-dependent hydrolase